MYSKKRRDRPSLAPKHFYGLKTGDTEKITINVGFVDLGHVDLIVAENFYSNRTDFIRTAIRNQLDQHRDVLERSRRRKQFELGLHDFSRQTLEAEHASGRTIAIRVVGLVLIAQDVSPELALATIGSVDVFGAFHAGQP